jgi:hypothetical protein
MEGSSYNIFAAPHLRRGDAPTDMLPSGGGDASPAFVQKRSIFYQNGRFQGIAVTGREESIP